MASAARRLLCGCCLFCSGLVDTISARFAKHCFLPILSTTYPTLTVRELRHRPISCLHASAHLQASLRDITQPHCSSLRSRLVTRRAKSSSFLSSGIQQRDPAASAPCSTAVQTLELIVHLPFRKRGPAAGKPQATTCRIPPVLITVTLERLWTSVTCTERWLAQYSVFEIVVQLYDGLLYCTVAVLYFALILASTYC